MTNAFDYGYKIGDLVEYCSDSLGWIGPYKVLDTGVAVSTDVNLYINSIGFSGPESRYRLYKEETMKYTEEVTRKVVLSGKYYTRNHCPFEINSRSPSTIQIEINWTFIWEKSDVKELIEALEEIKDALE